MSMSIPDLLSTDSEPSDEDLVKQMVVGDELALKVLVNRHSPRMAAWARQALGNWATPEDVEEVVSDAFVHAWRNRDSYNSDKAGVTTWLWWIVRFQCLSQRRTNSRQQRVLQATRQHAESLIDVWSMGPEDLEAIEGSEDARKRLERALAILGEKYPNDVEIVERRFLGHQSPSEIALFLGISDTATRVRLFRALGRLRGILKEEE